MRRGLRCIGALLTATVLATTPVLAGCSSGDDPEADPGASESTSGSPEPSESPTEETEPESEPVDPCSLLTVEDLEAVGLKPDMDTAFRALDPDPGTTACLVPDVKEGWAAYYGFSLEPNVSVPVAIEQVGTEKPVRLKAGEEARMVLYDAYDQKIWHAWASQEGYAVMVKLFAKPRPAQVEQLLSTMLDKAEPAMFEFPIDLPEGCPPPTSRPIVKVIGKVRTGTGSIVDDSLRCTYADRTGRSVELTTSTYKSKEKVDAAVRNLAEYYDERSTPAKGVTLLMSPGEAYSFSGGYVSDPPSYRGTRAQKLTPIGTNYAPGNFDLQAYRNLAAWWATQS